MKDCEEAIRLDPKSPDLAVAYLILGEVSMGKVLSLERAANKQHVRLTELLKYAEVNTDKPLKDLNEAIRLDPKLAQAYLWRGTLYQCQEKARDAIRDLEQCVRLDPDIALAYPRLGKLYESEKKLYQALGSYAEAAKRLPKDKAATANVERLTKQVRETWAKPGIKLVSLHLDEEMKQVVVKKSPPIRLAPDTEKDVKDTIRIHHTTSVSNTWKAETEARGKVHAWFFEIETALRGGIERSTNKTYGAEEEKERKVTVRGTKTGNGVRVIWVDYYRTGKAKVELDGEVLELPFEFKEDFDLVTEAVDSVPSK